MKYYTLLSLPYFIYWLGILLFGVKTEPMPDFASYMLILSWFLFSTIVFFLLGNILLDFIYNRYKSRMLFIIKTIIQSILLVIHSYLVLSYGYLNYVGVYHRTFIFDMFYTTMFAIVVFIMMHLTKVYISYIQIED